MELPAIDLQDYHYELPEERIARHPLAQRDASKLLVYAGGTIRHAHFRDLGQYLPPHTTLVFNDTKVIPARLFFQKDTGAHIEVFLLHPIAPSPDINVAMHAQGSSVWSCMIGNLKRWKHHQLLHKEVQIGPERVHLTAEHLGNDQVRLTWDPAAISFVDLVQAVGQVPLPPYLKREADLSDVSRYQTVYSKVQGAVAAPTAGLHFTDPLLRSLNLQGVTKEYLTLHVGAGTFQPIKTASVAEHPMHGEQIRVTRSNLQQLLEAENLVAVGTTSLRTLESLYWYGVILLNQHRVDFHIDKLLPYRDFKLLPDFREALLSVQDYLANQGMNAVQGYTEIFIFPPYRIRSCMGLITNFHLPGSTLMLLVAAFIGNEWRKIYQEALANDYRFLSYGDASLLLAANKS